MPATGRFQVQVPYAPDLPENVVVNNLYFHDAIANEFPGSTDWGALASDLAALWEQVWLGDGVLQRITVKVYDTAGPPPHDPFATHVRNPNGTVISANWPTQIALCLSFKGGQRPWQRGRIYTAPWQPATWSGASAVTPRPIAAQQTRLLDLADALSGLGGADIDWVVHSEAHGVDTKVNSAWVDDSWDIQRRRKLKPTARQTRSQSG